ncbi:hypothetical protein TRAPUB_2598 [Trametes pubescens]|uniref:Uncharacterized protein n=1 Tax=Trametes pubescens TaxID=154538 RepID=A0A1M2VFY2_TRAPU|nr:hypothetical protein TRAPUB_2598 [Trametes pubescens]
MRNEDRERRRAVASAVAMGQVYTQADWTGTEPAAQSRLPTLATASLLPSGLGSLAACVLCTNRLIVASYALGVPDVHGAGVALAYECMALLDAASSGHILAADAAYAKVERLLRL